MHSSVQILAVMLDNFLCHLQILQRCVRVIWKEVRAANYGSLRMRSGSPTEIGRVADVFKLAKSLLCCRTFFFYNWHCNHNLWIPKVPQAIRGALTSVGVWGAAILVRMLSCVAGCSSCGKTSSSCCETGRVQCSLCWPLKRWETGLQPASPLAGYVQCQCASILTSWAD